MSKQQLNPKNFTQTMGAYSHGLKVDIGDSEMIFVTGQIAMDKNGNAVAPKDIGAQTEFVFQNLQNITNQLFVSLAEWVVLVGQYVDQC